MIAMGIVQSWTFLILILLLVGFVTKPLADFADRILPDFNQDSELDDENSAPTEEANTEKDKSWTP